jgi:hypothetical protein
MIELLSGLGLGGLTCVYFAMLSIGIIYALVILVTGGLHDVGGDFDLGGGDADFGGGDTMHGAVDVTHVSPVTIAGFVTAFGAFGIISQALFAVSPGMSLLWASIGGLLVGVASHLAFFYFFIKPQGSSEVTRRDVVGAHAEVITPIPEGRVGEVAFIAQGARVTMTARSVDGRAIARGTVVQVREQIGSVVLVASTEDGTVPPSDPAV